MAGLNAAVVSASVLAAVTVACGTTSGAPAPAACDGVELLVAASDYTSSVVCGAPVCIESVKTTGMDLGVDPQLAASNGRAFFLARTEDTIFELDATCGTPTARFSLEGARAGGDRAGAKNPHDIAAAPDGSVFVALYGIPGVAVVRSGAVESTIDLSSYDEDGNPQAESIRILDVAGVPKAFVALERLDDDAGLRSTRPSSMLRIDVASRTVERVIQLAGRNPFNPMAELGSFLFLAEPGNFDTAGDDAAGIERFDTSNDATALLVTESALGGSVAEVAVTSGCGAAIVAGPEPTVNPTSVVTFDPDTGAVLTTAAAPVLGPTAGYDLQGLAWRDGALYVGDRRRGPGGYPVHILARSGRCSLSDSGRTLVLPKPAVALRPARSPR